MRLKDTTKFSNILLLYFDSPYGSTKYTVTHKNIPQ